jgi:predicted ArsR family transcriptional regulator
MNMGINNQTIQAASPPTLPPLSLKDVAEELGISFAAVRRINDSLGNDATLFFSM